MTTYWDPVHQKGMIQLITASSAIRDWKIVTVTAVGESDSCVAFGIRGNVGKI